MRLNSLQENATHLLMPPPPLRLHILPSPQPLLAPSAPETIAVHDLARLGQLDEFTVPELAVADGAGVGVGWSGSGPRSGRGELGW